MRHWSYGLILGLCLLWLAVLFMAAWFVSEVGK